MRAIRWLALATLWASACAATAANLAVTPVGVVLNARQDRQAITVQNQGAERVILQVEAVAWTQQDGVDRHEPTTDLVVNPPVFTVEPGQSRVVRVGLRDKPRAEQEVAYRLVVRQVPPQAEDTVPALVPSPQPGRVQVMLQLRLPVYVQPADPRRSQQWQAWRLADGGVAVEMDNTGSVHQTITGLDLLEGGTVKSSIRAGSAVLAGRSRRWEFRPADLHTQQVVLEAATDAGPQRVPLTLQPR